MPRPPTIDELFPRTKYVPPPPVYRGEVDPNDDYSEFFIFGPPDDEPSEEVKGDDNAGALQDDHPPVQYSPDSRYGGLSLRQAFLSATRGGVPFPRRNAPGTHAHSSAQAAAV